MCIDRAEGIPPRCKGLHAALCLFLLGPGTGSIAAEPGSGSFAEAVADGEVGIAFRYRFEHVDQDNFDEDANASTARLRLNYETASYKGWSSLVEFDYVTDVLMDDFNPGDGLNPDRTDFPVVADPSGPDLNQFFVDYNGVDEALFRIGRQRIVLDNQRFVGGVGWRQNEQTFDGASLRYSGWGNTELQYSYVSQVNRIFGEKSAAGQHNGNIHLLHANALLPAGWTLTGYGYVIDNDDVATFSTATFGVRGSGKLMLGGQTFDLVGEYATQSDTASAPVSYRADYWRLDATWIASETLTLGVTYERLGGDDSAPGKAFRTPLATLHAFQGWADQFLVTPDAGIRDLFFSLTWVRAGWTLQTAWHQFSADAGSRDWGQELDVSLARSFNDYYGVLMKAAAFDADDAPYANVTKFWLMFTANY